MAEHFAEAFGEKNLERLVLSCRVEFAIHVLGLLAVVTSD